MPGAIAQQPHHHKSTTKATQKPFKSRFSSKNELKDRARGRLETVEKGLRRTPHQHVMSKIDRKNHAKQMREQKTRQHEDVASIFKGKDAAPRIVAVVPLCSDVSAAAAVRRLDSSLDIEEEMPQQGAHETTIDRFRTKLRYLNVPKDLFIAMDACKLADFVLFIMSSSEEVDEMGELILRSIGNQGISNVYVAVDGLDSIDIQKHRQKTLTSLKSFIQHFFASTEKLHSLDSRQDCLNVVRSFCTSTPQGIKWREDRSWMQVEKVQWPMPNDSSDATTEVIVTGVVRGRNLKADRLVHVGDWGDFQISSIAAAPNSQSRKGKSNEMAVDGTSPGDTLDQPSEDQDTLEELAPEEIVMDDADLAPSLISTQQKGVLLDGQHYYSGDESEAEDERPKRIPKGTSKSQSIWYMGGFSDSGSDLEDFEDWEASTQALNETTSDGAEAFAESSRMEPEDAASEYPADELGDDIVMDDEVEEEELAAYRSRRRNDAAESDRQYPDEIELHPHVLARERLAKYRGLKSAKTSEWDREADRPHQPLEWNRLLDISDYKGAKTKVMREALIGGVRPGTRVMVTLKSVPLSLQQSYDPAKPLPLFSLLRHEHKRTCVNVSMTLKTDVSQPIKSKDELIVQIGPRRFAINPLFSQPGNTHNDVHKFERWLHPGRTAVASFTAPVTWGSQPVLFFKRYAPQTEDGNANGDMEVDADTSSTQSLQLIATGTTLPPSTGRIIAKRALLTGQPFKIHKGLVTIRYMFFNAEDVAWFKALPLWTNRAKQGAIKESLGTHGYFKAVFEGPIGQMDAVGMTLWKRVWPRYARELTVGDLAT